MKEKKLNLFIVILNIILYCYNIIKIFLIDAEPNIYFDNYDINFYLTIISILIYTILVILIILNYIKNNKKYEIFIKILSVIEIIFLYKVVFVVLILVLNILYFSNKKQRKIIMAILICIILLIVSLKGLSKYYYIGKAEGDKTETVLILEYKYEDHSIADGLPSSYSYKNFNVNKGDSFTLPFTRVIDNDINDDIVLTIVSLDTDSVEINCKGKDVILKYNEKYGFAYPINSRIKDNSNNGIDPIHIKTYNYIIKFQKRLIK